MEMTIGFIGQGFIGKNYANDFEQRGFKVVRYSLESPYINNLDKIKNCQIIFVAVPTPTTVTGFDYGIVEGAIKLTPPGSIVVIKSTVLPGTTEKLQTLCPDRILLHSPEFLRESTANVDAAKPERNIIGLAKNSPEHKAAAQQVLAVLPVAPYQLICDAKNAEYIKYAGNIFLFWKVVFANLMYDLVTTDNGDWEVISQALGADSRIGPSHLKVMHTSGHHDNKPGRGAGGHCFIKDFAALQDLYNHLLPKDLLGRELLKNMANKNIELLTNSGKDLDLLKAVYGDKL